ARDERVEGPADAADLAGERPLALVLLELAPPTATAVLGQQSGDVRVHGALAWFAEERHRRADHALLAALIVEQADDVVAGLLQRTQRAGIDHALGPADGVQQPLGIDDQFHSVEISNGSHDPSLPQLTNLI